jgi:aryl-alcohol dehydrogenase-like predicted oxidoreductase
LRRLQVETIDLIQFHENIRMEDPDRFFAPGGALEAVMAAKKAGKVRYIGFTGHKDPAVHLRMLDVAAQNKFHFDSCQMPLNVLDYHFRSFAQQVVPRLVKEGIAVLGMKPMAFGAVLAAGVATPIECLHYALNLPTSVVINGCDSMERLDQAFEAVRTFQPLSDAQLQAIVSKTKAAAKPRKRPVLRVYSNKGMTNEQLYLAIGVPMLFNAGLSVALALFIVSNAKFEAVNKRFDDMRDLWRAELHRVEGVLDARL